MTTDVRTMLLSADNHIVEPPDLWTARANADYLERVPRLVKGDDYDWWCVEGSQSMGSIGNTTQAGDRYTSEEPHKMTAKGRWESVRPGAYDPHESVADMEYDGVFGGAIFPTAGVGGIWRIEDTGLLNVVCSLYNEWIADFCKPYPDRLKGVAMLNLDNVEDGVRELYRAHELGLTAALITVYPKHERQYHNPEYEPLWAAAHELGMPLCLHSGSHRDGVPMDQFNDEDPNNPLGVMYCTQQYRVMRSIASMIWSKVFERYPGLKVASVENNAGWAPHFLYMMDLHHRDRGMLWPRFKNDMTPSDFFHRNVFLSFQEDWQAVRERDLIGVGNLMWGSDYPHTEGTWPDSKRVIDEIFSEVPDDEVRLMTHDNVAKVFGFN